MTLAVDCREFVPGRVTGIGRFLRGLLEEIARNRPHLTAVALAAPTAPVPVVAPHIRVHRLPQHITLYWDQVLLPRALRAIGATVFFSPYYKAPLVAPCPTVITIHDLIPVSQPEYNRGLGRGFAIAFRAWAAIMAHRAAAIVTDSEHSKAEVMSLLRISAESVHTILIGVTPEFHPNLDRREAVATVSRYGIKQPYLLAVGNFLPHKNLPRLVEAYEALPAFERSRISLVLAGTPKGYGLARPVDPATLARPGVIMPGFIDSRDLPMIYAGATALVCPSLAEGFGLPVLEAMACGTPVICARAGALPEVAAEAALYIDPHDTSNITAQIQRVLEDEELRRELGGRGIARAKLFDPLKTTVRLVDLLEAVAAG